MTEKSQLIFKVLVFIRFQAEFLSGIIGWCQKDPKVQQFSTLTGEYDGIIEVELQTLPDLYLFYTRLDQLDGIQTVNSHIVMQEWNS